MLTNEEIVVGRLPLTDDEYGMLRTIYYTRLRFFLIVLFGLGAATFWKLFDLLSMDGGLSEIMNGNFHRVTSIPAHYWLIFLFFDFLAIMLVALLYFKRILPVKKDFKNNWKEIIYYPIIQKQHFEHTGQFFIGTNHPDYLFHEVDYETWQNMNIDDNFAVSRAPLSRYVFNKRGKYTII